MMNFKFPKDKTIDKNSGMIKNRVAGKLHSIDILKPETNQITIKGIDYTFKHLDEKIGNKGGNSVILKLYETQNLLLGELDYGEADLILKILKFPIRRRSSKAHKRFRLERIALHNCNKKKFNNVMSLYHSGKCTIDNFDYLYYSMETAQTDLKEFMEKNSHISLEERVDMCIELANGLKELLSIGIYHRDIKPDNIFFIDGKWKIGDLGLISHRDVNFDLDRSKGWIGPRGWISPEALNKFLCEEIKLNFKHNIIIDHQSDIFQLGKVFIYILQQNNPIGIFKQSDLHINNSYLYQIVRTMINYSKDRRYQKIEEVIRLLKPIQKNLIKQ